MHQDKQIENYKSRIGRLKTELRLSEVKYSELLLSYNTVHSEYEKSHFERIELKKIKSNWLLKLLIKWII